MRIMNQRNWISIVAVMAVVGCSSATPEDEAVADDALTAKSSLSCYPLEPCSLEHSIGYCAQYVRVAATAKGETVTVMRYSSIADRDLTDEKDKAESFTQSNAGWSAEWDSGHLAVNLDPRTKQYTGHLVIDHDKDFEIACTDDTADPCTLAQRNGTYCGSNLVFDSARALHLFTCNNGKTTAQEVCPSSCGTIVENVDGRDYCLK
jgi:hypothetical protein